MPICPRRVHPRYANPCRDDEDSYLSLFHLQLWTVTVDSGLATARLAR